MYYYFAPVSTDNSLNIEEKSSFNSVKDQNTTSNINSLEETKEERETANENITNSNEETTIIQKEIVDNNDSSDNFQTEKNISPTPMDKVETENFHKEEDKSLMPEITPSINDKTTIDSAQERQKTSKNKLTKFLTFDKAKNKNKKIDSSSSDQQNVDNTSSDTKKN
ncbi:MAG: hypothetical protein Q8888_01865 [Vigna little leaf phytoplasma]|nr:hypothetical protein [Vigna little leaf phytoplasma]